MAGHEQVVENSVAEKHRTEPSGQQGAEEAGRNQRAEKDKKG